MVTLTSASAEVHVVHSLAVQGRVLGRQTPLDIHTWLKGDPLNTCSPSSVAEEGQRSRVMSSVSAAARVVNKSRHESLTNTSPLLHFPLPHFCPFLQFSSPLLFQPFLKSHPPTTVSFSFVQFSSLLACSVCFPSASCLIFSI